MSPYTGGTPLHPLYSHGQLPPQRNGVAREKTGMTRIVEHIHTGNWKGADARWTDAGEALSCGSEAKAAPERIPMLVRTSAVVTGTSTTTPREIESMLERHRRPLGGRLSGAPRRFLGHGSGPGAIPRDGQGVMPATGTRDHGNHAASAPRNGKIAAPEGRGRHYRWASRANRILSALRGGGGPPTWRVGRCRGP